MPLRSSAQVIDAIAGACCLSAPVLSGDSSRHVPGSACTAAAAQIGQHRCAPQGIPSDAGPLLAHGVMADRTLGAAAELRRGAGDRRTGADAGRTPLERSTDRCSSPCPFRVALVGECVDDRSRRPRGRPLVRRRSTRRIAGRCADRLYARPASAGSLPSLRVADAAVGQAGREVAIGAEWQPDRVAAGAGGRRKSGWRWMAARTDLRLGVIAGINPTPVALGFRLEGLWPGRGDRSRRSTRGLCRWRRSDRAPACDARFGQGRSRRRCLGRGAAGCRAARCGAIASVR